MNKEFKPYVPAKETLREFSFKAVFLGVIMSMIFAGANAYLGMTAGMTVAATFPAAVIAMAFMRLFKGTVLEENMARTTGAVGEALAASAVFVIPAFVISGVWESFDYAKSTIFMMVGGVLGVLFVIILRKALIEDQTLLYPESKASAEIVKAGQHGSTGAGVLFGAMGLAAAVELFKNVKGITLIKDTFRHAIQFGASKITLLTEQSRLITSGDKQAEFTHDGCLLLQTPKASPAFLGVGYIVGFRLATITFSGGVFGWLFLLPLVIFLMSGDLSFFSEHGWIDIAKSTYNATVKPVAVGGMLVGSFYRLFTMRRNLIGGLTKGVADLTKMGRGDDSVSRVDRDAPFGMILVSILVLVFVMVLVFQQIFQLPTNPGWGSAIGTTLVMALAGFLFASAAGYLVGLVGSSSNPISGLALTSLLLVALLMVLMGQTGISGVIATLGVAAVVACSVGVAGDMMQDWKVGHILGGTPWKMQLGGIIGVIAASAVLVLPIMLLDKVPGDPTGHAIGTDSLPAPQAGLMAMMAKGIVGGQMAWPLFIAGMFFGVALILLKTPSPIFIAVGMYLPFDTTFAIFIGGLIKFVMDHRASCYADKKAEAEKLDGEEMSAFMAKIQEKSENFGLLLASGLVAGEALMGIFLAGIMALNVNLNELLGNVPRLADSLFGTILYFLVFGLLAYVMIYIPIRGLRKL